MTFATLNEKVAARVRVQVPAWGAWWADVDLAEPDVLSGAATLVLADKTLTGTIVSGGASTDTSRASYRIVGGAGGWGKTIPKKAYVNDAGVKLANVIRDVASACGETLADVPTTKLGPHYARADGPAFRTLNQLAPQAWHVGFDGVTRFGLRASVAYSGDGARTRIDPGGAILEISTDEIGALLPGVTIDGSNPATDVEYYLDTKKLTVRVYAGRSVARRLLAWSQILEALVPNLKYFGTYEFRVVTQSGERLNLQPVRAATGLPDLANVPVRPGMAGLRSNVQLGELVLVTFVDADPSRPVVVSHDAPDAPGWMPLTLELGGPGALGVARMTDPVIAGPFAGTITLGSVRVKAAT